MSSEIDADEIAYIDAMIAREDPDLSLAHRYIAVEDRPRIGAICALALELRRIPATVTEPHLGEIRLQWWRDELDSIQRGIKPRAHPVLRPLWAAGLVDVQFRATAELGIDARARLLYPGRFDTPDDMFGFFRDAEGWAATACGDSVGSSAEAGLPEAQRAALADLGAAHAMAKWGRLAPAAFDAKALTEFSLAVYGNARGAVTALHTRALAACLYLALTPGYARRAPGSPWGVGKRLALVKSMLSGRL